MRQSVRFLHCADLHLDSPYKGLHDLPDHILHDIKNSTFQAFDRLVDLAISEHVDFVLIVGDVFDQQSVSLKSLVHLKEGLKQLNDHEINVYISFGNHDYQMLEKVDLSLPERTYIFPSEEVTAFTYQKGGEAVAHIYGFSYQRRAVTENKVREYLPKQESGFHIATLHGSLQSNEEHDHYAPFLLQELKEKSFDYWALGHIHQRSILSKHPLVVYPGNIQGRHMKETGDKGCYLVELSDASQDLSFQSLQSIRFREDTLEFLGCTSGEELLERLKQYKADVRSYGEKVIVRVTVEINFEMKHVKELVTILNEDEATEQIWVWFQGVKFEYRVNYDREQLKKSNRFASEVIQMIDEADIEGYLQDLLNNRTFRQHMRVFDQQSIEEIKEEAEQLVMQKLLKGGRD
ncbi:metallophosphoesterase family protein [Alkalibacillus aidingensis]|uniref:metallophosphoesterase family protein n=1 Tax=Alkalibacillus aidingensis TaxID=2747607 RepID=UPI001660F83A|nr:DNA repair exonuclease [Alkalibacillus aidingensis]